MPELAHRLLTEVQQWIADKLAEPSPPFVNAVLMAEQLKRRVGEVRASLVQARAEEALRGIEPSLQGILAIAELIDHADSAVSSDAMNRAAAKHVAAERKCS